MACLDPTAASEYVEGLLEPSAASEIEAHLADCGDCRKLMVAIAAPASGEEQSKAESGLRPTAPAEGTKTASRAAFLNPGMKIGRFVIGESLGRGGMGVVYGAHDPELDRQVAIKLLRFDYPGERNDEAEARLLREARAMARLSHPNVVTVYEVGSDRGFVFIAMELLGGETLERWLEQAPRTTDQILAAFAGAGRGLAAAHEAGLVHRDFKPTNVIVEKSGSAVVLDFGLVSDETGSAPAEEPPEIESTESSASLTATGAMLGTPAYMAPEQLLGEQADARSDQWSFAVCLYEALTDEHPFIAADFDALRKRVVADSPRPLPSRVPRRIRRAVMRGLSRTPESRFSSMTELVRQLEGRTRARWLWLIAALTVVATAAVLFAISSRQSQLCSGADAKAAALWNPSVKDEIRSSFIAVGLSYAARAAETTIENLESHFARWRTLSRETCRAARVTRELSEGAMERTMQCLETGLREAEALTALFASADRSIVATSEQATAQLADLERCRDRRRLSAIAPAPTDAETAAAAERIQRETAELKALVDVGDIGESLRRARALEGPAKDLGVPAIAGAALYWLGRALEAAGLYADADAALRESAYAALAAADDRQVVLTATALVRVVGFRKAELERGEEWHQIGRASLARGEPDRALSQDLDAARAKLLAAGGSFDKAEKIATSLLEAMIADYGAGDLRVAETHSSLGNYCSDQYRYECGEEHFRKALKIFTDHYGPEHPAVAGALTDLGQNAAAQGKFDVALKNHRRAIAIREAGLASDHPELGRSYHNISYSLIATGKLDEALRACKRALEITNESLGPDNPRNAATYYHLGYLYWSQKKFDLAFESHERALEIRAAAFGDDHAYVADIQIELGRTRRDQLRYSDAAAHYKKALTIRRRKLGSTDSKTVYTMTDLGSMYVLLGDHRRALPLLEEAALVWQADKSGVPEMIAMNQFFLAQAVWETGGSKQRARELARASIAGYKSAGNGEAASRSKRWLASH